MPFDEAELLRLAEKEILGEAKRAAVRYSVAGPSGWNPCPLQKTNKTFLFNTLQQTVSSNRIKDDAKSSKPKKRRERKLFQGKKSHGFCNDNVIFKAPVRKKLERKNEKSLKEMKISNKIIKNVVEKKSEKSGSVATSNVATSHLVQR